MPTAIAPRLRRDPVRTASNHLYRIPEVCDLQPGLELLMVDPKDWRHDPEIIGTRIRVESLGPSVGSTGVTVYYRCIDPAWEHECYAYAEDIVRLSTGRKPRTHLQDTLFWLPREFEPTES